MVARMAEQGYELASIAKALGIGHAAFRECRRRQDEVQEALDQGHAALSDELVHGFLAAFRKGNIVAGIYLSKARLGWRENDTPDTRPNIVINLPGALSEEQYAARLKVVDGTPSPSPGQSLPAPAKKVVR